MQWTAGFAEISNKHELLMVQCPLPELRDRGPDWQLRLYLLQQAGLTPQLFLTQDFIEGFKHKPRSHLPVRGRLLTDCLYDSLSEHAVMTVHALDAS